MKMSSVPSSGLFGTGMLVCFLVLVLVSSASHARSTPPSEGGSYRLSRTRVAAGTTEALSAEAGTPRYRLQATVGQAEADPDAAASMRYRLRGGFWAAHNAGELPPGIFADGFED